MGLFDIFKRCVTEHYADFEGRAGRREYWMFVLGYVLISFGVAIIGAILHLRPLTGLCALALLLPHLAVGARRLHDRGRSGWWQLIILLPVIGLIWLWIWFLLPSDEGGNAYGNQPV